MCVIYRMRMRHSRERQISRWIETREREREGGVERERERERERARARERVPLADRGRVGNICSHE
jgi:hypothetical protein